MQSLATWFAHGSLGRRAWAAKDTRHKPQKPMWLFTFDGVVRVWA